MRLLLPLLLALAACTPGTDGPASTTADSRARQLVADAIVAHGGDAYNPATITFAFRADTFVVALDGGRFAYTRRHRNVGGEEIRDVLDNDGLRRTVNGQPAALDAAQMRAATSTANSVPYFVLLPYRLHDPAVVGTYAGADTVAGEPYERVAVSFHADGGGPDFEDRYLYWFHRDRHTMDFLAYTFDDGTRFRAAQNAREIGGLRFADYLNLTAADSLLGGDLARYGNLYDAGALDTVSVVEITNVRVRRP